MSLTFAPDPQLNSELDVLGAVKVLQLVLDSKDGFSGVTSAGPAGDFDARDVDGDRTLELVVQRTVAGSSLPAFRLLPGSNAQRTFTLTAQGLGAAGVLAAGGQLEASFAAAELQVPFNLRADLRAPRVVSTTPATGQMVEALDVTVVFSKIMDASAPSGSQQLLGGLQLVYLAAAGPVQVPGSWTVGSATVDEWGQATERSRATFALAPTCSPVGGSYRIEAQTSLRDLQGRSLDQDASAPGPNGFTASFVLAGTATTPQDSPCAACTNGACGDCRKLPDLCTKLAQACDPDTGQCEDCKIFCQQSCQQNSATCDACLKACQAP